jgi:uncharacterized spore protein YtfJ
MNQETNEFLQSLQSESERRASALERLLSTADCSKVFGDPTTSGEYTVICAAEIAAGGGFGSGFGFGMPKQKDAPAATEDAVPGDERQAGRRPTEGAGGGGGGGGGSMGRPVAAIVIGPDGVQVKPVLDMTKIGLTALGAWSAVALLALKLAKTR